MGFVRLRQGYGAISFVSATPSRRNALHSARAREGGWRAVWDDFRNWLISAA
jgi:hypothetical protein